jgi:molybdate transport system substrate-binding protein
MGIQMRSVFHWMRGAAVVAAALSVVMLVTMPASRAHAADEVVVFAAASLKTALDDIAGIWTKQTGARAKISYAGSSKLAKQIQQGAPADLYFSANIDWMDVLDKDKLIDPASRRDLLRNRLVLIAHGKDAEPVELGPGFDLAGKLKDGRLAMAMVGFVPAGIFGKEALTALGLWSSVAPKVAQADNVRAALALVARGEAPFGIVYATDASASDKVTVIATFPADTHRPIIYPAAVLSDSPHRDAAARFLEFLSSASARTIFERQGFTVMRSLIGN